MKISEITNKRAKELLRLLKRDKIISEGEYQRIWNDYKQLKKEKEGGGN